MITDLKTILKIEVKNMRQLEFNILVIESPAFDKFPLSALAEIYNYLNIANVETIADISAITDRFKQYESLEQYNEENGTNYKTMSPLVKRYKVLTHEHGFLIDTQ